MLNSLKVSGFVLFIVAVIAGFASLIPQLESPAPEQLEIEGELSGEELAALGEDLFGSAEAGCLACHGLGSPGLRAPDLAGIGAAAAERVDGMTAEEYLSESLRDPCAYVVAGYDCIMPVTLEQTLGEAKLIALTAFLQSLGGEVTVRLTSEALEKAEPATDGGIAGDTGGAIFANAGCPACHTLEATGATGQVGPDLSQLGERLSEQQIREAILFPDATLAEECPAGPCQPGLMPKVFGDRLTAAQLETLVGFLSGEESP